MLATSFYLQQQTALHKKEHYGNQGHQWCYIVAGIRIIERCDSVLDYGCGKGTLGRMLRSASIPCIDYDPALAEFSHVPAPCDLVVCTDVLEHIEPDCIDAVLADLRRVTKKILFVVVCLRRSSQHLNDGRNAHILLKSKEWWRTRIESVGFTMRRDWKSDEWWIAMLQRRR